MKVDGVDALKLAAALSNGAVGWKAVCLANSHASSVMVCSASTPRLRARRPEA